VERRIVTALATAPTLFDDLGGEATLDDLIVGVWEGLTAHKAVGCVACGESMLPEYGAHAMPVGGRCTSCGTRLS
jgi:hypothetical protein